MAQNPSNDEAYLRAAKITPDAKGLLEYFQSRSLRGEQIGHVEKLLDDLGNSQFKVRESATNELVDSGTRVLPALRSRIHDPDPERRRRVEACIRDIERSGATNVGLAMPAARMLVRLKPPGAADALLTFLPFNEDEWVEEEVLTALTELAREQRSLDPVVLGFLNDPHPSRRSGQRTDGRKIGRAGASTCRPQTSARHRSQRAPPCSPGLIGRAR